VSNAFWCEVSCPGVDYDVTHSLLEQATPDFVVKASGIAIKHGLTRPSADVADREKVCECVGCCQWDCDVLLPSCMVK
jgi:hypothetical protein